MYDQLQAAGGGPLVTRPKVLDRRFEWKFTMEMSRARALWKSQCDVAPSIREKYGLQAAFDYLVSEKLLNFFEAAASHPDFTHELPMFVAEVRRIFKPEEIRQQFAMLVPKVEAADKADGKSDDEFETISPQDLTARLERLSLMKQLLEADYLGIS